MERITIAIFVSILSLVALWGSTNPQDINSDPMASLTTMMPDTQLVPLVDDGTRNITDPGIVQADINVRVGPRDDNPRYRDEGDGEYRDGGYQRDDDSDWYRDDDGDYDDDSYRDGNGDYWDDDDDVDFDD